MSRKAEYLAAWRKANPEKHRAACARYRAKHHDAYLATVRAWRSRNPEKVLDMRRRLVRNNPPGRRSLLRFAIDEGELRQIFENQEGLCAICSQPMCLCIGTTHGQCPRKLCVDHDHVTGDVRGLLHNGCNRALGLFADSPSFLRNAAGYLEGSGV